MCGQWIEVQPITENDYGVRIRRTANGHALTVEWGNANGGVERWTYVATLSLDDLAAAAAAWERQPKVTG